jgi:hypothetical protein
MRNYIAFVKQDFDIWNDDGVNPPVLSGVLLHVEDDEDAMAAFAATLPSSGPIFYVPQTEPYPYWPKMDKAVIKEVLNGASPGSFNHWLAAQAQDGTPEKDPTWPTSDGDIGRERQEKASGTQTGSTGKSAGLTPNQVTFLQFLAGIYADLLQINNATAADCAKKLLRVMNQFQNGTLTQAQALAKTKTILKPLIASHPELLF